MQLIPFLEDDDLDAFREKKTFVIIIDQLEPKNLTYVQQVKF